MSRPALALEAAMSTRPPTPHRTVVVGAGFAGLAAARRLRALGADVTVVDQRSVTTFQPLLYQVATAALSADVVSHPVRTALRRGALGRARGDLRFQQATVADLDLERRQVVLADGSALPYDTLVLALGAVYDDLGIPGVRRHAYTLGTLQGALALRTQLLAQLEAAARDPDDEAARTFAVAGAGPTGVETAGALSELLAAARREAPELAGRPLRVVLLEPSSGVLNGYAASSCDYTEARLRRLGVDVRLGTGVARVAADHVTLDDGSTLATRTLVWAAGVRAHPLAERLGVSLERGHRVPVGSDLTLPGRPEVFVIGDLTGHVGAAAPHPQVAQVALQMGEHVGRVWRARSRGVAAPAFRYRDRGQMAIIGRHAAVAEIAHRFGSLRLRGMLAWLAWLGVHVAYLRGVHERVAALVAWLHEGVWRERSERASVAVEPVARGRGWLEQHERRFDQAA